MNTYTTNVRAEAEFRHQVTLQMRFVRRQAKRLTRNSFEADDLAQDTMEKALGSRHLYKEENLRGWLNVMLLRVHLNRRRHERRMWNIAPLQAAYDARCGYNLAERFVLQREIEEALSLLPKPDRDMTEKACTGYGEREIAEGLGRSRSWLKNRVYRNKLILRRRLRS